MDFSALIFVALAVAWAVYLVPKALKHHDEVVRSRSVDRFSHTMRVLARREPVDRRNARLVVTPSRATAPPVVTTKPLGPAPVAEAHPGATAVESAHAAVSRATRRRRRVLGLILVANAAVVTVAAFSLISWWYVAAPAGLLLAWLVACRVLVKGERRRWAPQARPAAAPETVAESAQEVAHEVVVPVDAFEDTTSTPAVVDAGLWDPMPVTLPTYVTKPVATRRSVRTIDLDSTGVWTSGRTDADAQIAREADEAERIARAQRDSGSGSRAVGS